MPGNRKKIPRIVKQIINSTEKNAEETKVGGHPLYLSLNVCYSYGTETTLAVKKTTLSVTTAKFGYSRQNETCPAQ